MVQLKRVISILGAMLLAATGAAVQSNDLRAAAVGAEIRAEHEVYRLVRGGNVDLTDGVEQSASTRQSSAGWQARLGRFELSIDPRAGTRSTSSAVPDTTYQLAFNPRTGNPAVVTGMIITKLAPGTDAGQVASSLGLTVAAEFDHLDAAVFQTHYADNLAAQVDALQSDYRVVNAYAEVIEHLPTAR